MHVAAVVDLTGTTLATESFSTTRAGYRAVVRWLRSFGDVRVVGVRGRAATGRASHATCFFPSRRGS